MAMDIILSMDMGMGMNLGMGMIMGMVMGADVVMGADMVMGVDMDMDMVMVMRNQIDLIEEDFMMATYRFSKINILIRLIISCFSGIFCALLGLSVGIPIPYIPILAFFMCLVINLIVFGRK